MAASSREQDLSPRLGNVLAHLPISNSTEYRKGQVIYCPDHPSQSMHLVVSGKVEISQLGGKGRDLLLEIIRPGELFGESAFLDVPCRTEIATAFERASVVAWAITDMEDLVMKRPHLAVTLLQVIAQRNIDFARRIESFSSESIEQRLARALIRFSERLGTPQEDGSWKMMPFTHELLSRYVGTSREIISHHMGLFRRQGYVSYSRQGIVLYHAALQASIN